MESLKIILFCIAVAIVYGILHDQVTARVCVEYFTIGHPPIFGTESPTILAFGWGVMATWWCGLILGLLAVIACRFGSMPKKGVHQLIRPVTILLVIMAFVSLLAGIAGYGLAKVGIVQLFGLLATKVPPSKHVVFLADLWAHITAYAVGLIGGSILCVRVWRQRRQEVMTKTLQAAFEKAAALPPARQESLAAILLKEIAAEASGENEQDRTLKLDRPL